MKTTYDYFLLILDHYKNEFDLDMNILFSDMSDFMLTHGEEAIKSLWGSICWSNYHLEGEKRTLFQREIYYHDVVNGKNDKWMLPRSSDYKQYIIE